MTDDDTFPSAAAYLRHSGPVMGKTIQCMAGAEHRRNRALVSAAFRPRLMKEFVEAFLTPVAHQLVDELIEGGEPGRADLVRDYTVRYAFTVITRLLDFPPTDFEQLKRWGDGLIDFPWNPQFAEQASREFTAYLKPIIDERRRSPGEDLISSLCTTEIDGESLDDEEIYSFIRLLFPAGADTTYRGLGSMFYAVLRHPEVWQAVKADPALIPAVVQEALRWEGPTALLPRFAPKDVSFAGCEIPAGSEVIFGITSANRDARVFADPDRFDPWRKERESLSFGHGLHFCLGPIWPVARWRSACGCSPSDCPTWRWPERRRSESRGRCCGARRRFPSSSTRTRAFRHRSPHSEKRERRIEAGSMRRSRLRPELSPGGTRSSPVEARIISRAAACSCPCGPWTSRRGRPCP